MLDKSLEDGCKRSKIEHHLPGTISVQISCTAQFKIHTIFIQFSNLHPISSPFLMSAPFECVFVNKCPHFNYGTYTMCQ